MQRGARARAGTTHGQIGMSTAGKWAIAKDHAQLYRTRGWGSFMGLGVSDARDLLDSGATHFVHPSDAGAIEGTWRPDIEGLTLGNKDVLPCYGSVEKHFVVGDGGPDIKRRVLIAQRTLCLSILPVATSVVA